MTEQDVLNELNKLVGKEFNEDDVIIAFGDYEENGVTDVIVSETSVSTNVDGFGKCKLWNAYIDLEESTIFAIAVAGNNIIAAVWDE